MKTVGTNIIVLAVVLCPGCFGRTDRDEQPLKEVEPVTQIHSASVQRQITPTSQETELETSENTQPAPIISGLTPTQSVTLPTDLSHIYTGHIRMGSGKMVVALNGGQGSEFISVDPENLSPNLKTTLNPKGLELSGELSWQLSAVAIDPNTGSVYLNGSSASMEGGKLRGSNFFAMMNGMIPKTLKSYLGNSFIGVSGGENVGVSGMDFRMGAKGVQMLDVFANLGSAGGGTRSFWVVLDSQTADVRQRYELPNSRRVAMSVLPWTNTTGGKNTRVVLAAYDSSGGSSSQEVMKLKFHPKTGKVDIERILISGLPSGAVIKRGYVYDTRTAIGVGIVPVNKSQRDLALMRFEMNAGQAKTSVVRAQMDSSGRTIMDVEFDPTGGKIFTLSMKEGRSETPEIMIHEFKMKTP